MNKIQIASFFIVFAACGQNHQVTELALDGTNSEMVKLIAEGFSKYDVAYFNRKDSCIFMSYITHDYNPSITSRSYRYSDNFFFISNSCPTTNFGFCILAKKNVRSPLYYGQSDVYYLRYSNDLALGEITQFSNSSLEELLNQTIGRNLTGNKDQDLLKINSFLYYLYFENIFTNVSHPVFVRKLRVSELLNEYNVGGNAHIINNDFKDFTDENVMIFENPEIGTFIFIVDISNTRNISIKEYIILSETRATYFRSDGLPTAYSDSCR